MALTNTFYQAVEEKNIRRIRIMLKDSLLTDNSFKLFAEMEKEAENKGIDLYEKHDGRELLEDVEKWDEAYMNQLMVQAISNFSRERIGHLKKVVRYLYPYENTGTQNRRETERPSGNYRSRTHRESYQERKRKDQREGTYIRPEYLAGAAAGAVAGGAAAAGISVIAVGEIIVGAVGAGVVVGAAAGMGVAAAVLGGGKDE